jgi:hypothetical protein
VPEQETLWKSMGWAATAPEMSGMARAVSENNMNRIIVRPQMV